MANSTVTLKWYGDAVGRHLKRELTTRVGSAARILANQLTTNLSVQGPPASAPGEFPHKVSGALVESVGIAYNDSEPSATVYVAAEHAKYVEKMRPFFIRTQREMMSRLRSLVSKPTN